MIRSPQELARVCAALRRAADPAAEDDAAMREALARWIY